MRVLNEKWSKYCLLIQENNLRSHLPETQLLSEESFYEFLNKYYQLYLRPCLEDKIIILVTTLKDNLFEIQSGNMIVTIVGKQAAYTYIEKNLLQQKKFIVQQGIPYVTVSANPFDVRVFLTRQSANWQIAERVARVTPIGFSVTDEVKDIFPIEEIIPKAYPASISNQDICLQLDKVALQTAKRLEERYAKYNLLIIDFGLDQIGKPWVHEVRYKFLEGKWDYHQVLRGEKRLHSYLPETYPFHEKILLAHLYRDGYSIIKPYLSQWGVGLALVSCLSDRTYKIHSEKNARPYNTLDEVISQISDRFISKKRYIIQEKIPLGTIDGSPFDLRVMVQRKTVTSEWVVTGKMARTAADGFVVTNVAKGLSTVKEAIEKSSLKILQIERLLLIINQICIVIAEQMEKVYPNSRKWGIDIGIAQNGKPWIIEANLKPDISLFYYLSDKTMYKTIKEYAKGEENYPSP